MLIVCLTPAVKEVNKNNSFLFTGRQVITSTSNTQTRHSFEMLSLSECIPWMTVGLAESVAIVTFNLCTIIVFIRNRNLRKRNMYLVINLAVSDMLAGGAAVYFLFYGTGFDCNLWKWASVGDGTHTFIEVLMVLFPISSLTNMATIALERMHATVRPFRHRVLKKWVYRLIVTVAWVISGLISIACGLVLKFEETRFYGLYLHATFSSICLLIICVSYTSIVIKIRCGAQPQHHGAISRERKLTMTLLMVTVVSLLLYLPNVIYRYVGYLSKFEIWWSLPPSMRFHLTYGFLFLYFGNSIANPILYAIRLPEYRSAVLALFCKRPEQRRQVADFPLRDM